MNEGCSEPLIINEKGLYDQLDYFSRRLDKRYYTNAMKIYDEL